MWVYPERSEGPLAQLVERLHGMQKVTGPNPVRSTLKILNFKF